MDENENISYSENSYQKLCNLIEENEYREIVSQLNHKQYVLDSVIAKKGAGEGKSRWISAIYQSLLRHFNAIPGNDPHTIRVMLTAPTGKASFAIKSMTIHSSFGIPVNVYKGDILPLNRDKANMLNNLLSHLRLIIIDEFSMVGATMLEQIHMRLKHIFRNNEDFAVRNLLVGPFQVFRADRDNAATRGPLFRQHPQ
ncbi:unnamed protein product [Brassicogethes aeneus]|uniref:ATP-dependent DNA helicase n=1 Tax=Brassicogethes aeneus TaxID=1431903 RepID=A0A9P0BA16_BRAAE|nr:unnamed protein product [Brassicogethes aeneus]